MVRRSGRVLLVLDKELYTAEKAYEMTMKDIKAIYDEKDAV